MSFNDPATEIRPIPGYESLYGASRDGRIYAYLKKTCGLIPTREYGGRWLSGTCKDGKGYFSVDLYKNGIRTRKRIHRLVAMAWIPNPDGLPQVNHRNGIKSDNRVENLEWVTPRTNILHAFETGLNRSRKDLSGRRFGRLVAIRGTRTHRRNRLWLCDCDCGAQVEVQTTSLTSGRTQSCGCRMRDINRLPRAQRSNHAL
jgi:hypothetical protein